MPAVVSRLNQALVPDLPYGTGAPLVSPKGLLRDRRRAILAETASRILAGEDIDSHVLPMLYESLAAERLVDASLGFVVTEGSQTMRLGFIKGFPKHVVERCVTLDFGQAICGTVALTGKAIHATDIQRTLDPMADLVRSAGINAYACEPLLRGNRVLGTLSFASRARRSFDGDDLQFFRAVARDIAIARERKDRSDD
jgi:GAF domain-containing protein